MEGLALLISVVGIGGQILNIVALVRAYRTPEWAYDRLGKDRGSQRWKHWIGVFTGLGAFFGWHWLLKIRPELDKVSLAVKNSRTSWSPPAPKNLKATPVHPKRPVTRQTEEVTATRDSSSEPCVVLEEDSGVEDLLTRQSGSLLFASVAPVSKTQVERAVRSQVSNFLVTQETLTGIALAAKLKRHSGSERLSGFELSNYFGEGAATGRLLFSLEPKANLVLKESSAHELASSIAAVREDSEYLQSMAFEVLESFLDTLPAGVGQYLSESVAEEQVSELEAEFLTRMFVLGIAYIGFQTPTAQ